eukprot:scaffold8447_cov66-Cyclotella_meneghiniana.AAC.14
MSLLIWIASDGFEYGVANEGFDEEDGAGMWQQADCQICHRSIPEHNIMASRKPQGLRNKQGGKNKGYQWDFSDEEGGDDEPKRQDDDDEEEEEGEEVEQVKPRGKGMSGCRVSDQSSYSQLSREEETMRLSCKFTVNRNKIVQDMRQTREKEPPCADTMMKVLGMPHGRAVEKGGYCKENGD